MKNITFNADEELIKKAREKAQREHTTLNESFRKWIKRYINSDKTNFNYDELMQKLEYANPGQKFTREELNER